MHGGAATLVAGVHRREHVDHLGAADLADDEPVGPHPQRLPDQRAQGDLAGALDVGRPRLERRRRGGGRGAARRRPRPAPAARSAATRESRALSRVVLPLPVPPLTRNARRRRTTGSQQLGARRGDRAGRDQLGQGEHPLTAGPAARATVPGRDTGASTAWKRVPSAQPQVDVRRRRRRAAAHRRPPAAGRAGARPASSGNRTPVRSSPAPRSTPDLVGAVDQDVGDARRAAAAARAGRRRRRRGAARRAPRARSRRRPGRPAPAAPGRPAGASAARPRGRAARGPRRASSRREGLVVARALMRRPVTGTSTSTLARAARASGPRRESRRAGAQVDRLVQAALVAHRAQQRDPRSRLTDSGRTPAGRPRVTR